MLTSARLRTARAEYRGARRWNLDGKMGERLLALRKEHGLTQEQLAEKIFVTRQAVSKWERGESVPDLELLVALAELYGVTLDELVTGSGAPAEDSRSASVDTDVFRKSRMKKLLLRMAVVFVLSVGVWGLFCGIIHSACLSVVPEIWIVWFTLPIAPPLTVLIVFFHYIPAEWRAYFVLVPFVSGIIYLAAHYASGGEADASWLAFLLIPIYYIPAALYTFFTLRAKKRAGQGRGPFAVGGEQDGHIDKSV